MAPVAVLVLVLRLVGLRLGAAEWVALRASALRRLLDDDDEDEAQREDRGGAAFLADPDLLELEEDGEDGPA